MRNPQPPNYSASTAQRRVRKLVSELAANADARAQAITLALVLGALESRFTKDALAQRTPAAHRALWEPDAVRHLRRLPALVGRQRLPAGGRRGSRHRRPKRREVGDPYLIEEGKE